MNRSDVSRSRSKLGVFSMIAGVGWKVIEVWHGAEFIKKNVLEITNSEWFAGFMASSVGPTLCMTFGCVWGAYFLFLESSAHNAVVRITNEPATRDGTSHVGDCEQRLALPDISAAASGSSELMQDATFIEIREITSTTTKIIKIRK